MERRGSRKESENVDAEEVRKFIEEARGKFGSLREGKGWRIDIDGCVLNGVVTDSDTSRNSVTTSKIYINQDPGDKSGQASLELNIYRNLNGETHDSRHFALSVIG